MKSKKRVRRTRKSSTKNWGMKGESVAMPSTVVIPAGKCPFIIEEFDEDLIIDWVVSLTEHKSTPVTYLRSVYVYWLRHSFDINSQEFKDARSIVEEVVPEQVKQLSDLNIEIA